MVNRHRAGRVQSSEFRVYYSQEKQANRPRGHIVPGNRRRREFLTGVKWVVWSLQFPLQVLTCGFYKVRMARDCSPLCKFPPSAKFQFLERKTPLPSELYKPRRLALVEEIVKTTPDSVPSAARASGVSWFHVHLA